MVKKIVLQKVSKPKSQQAAKPAKKLVSSGSSTVAQAATTLNTKASGYGESVKKTESVYLFEALNLNGEITAITAQRERHYSGVIPNGIANIEDQVAQTRALIQEIADVLRPVLNADTLVEQPSSSGVFGAHSSTTDRLSQLAESARNNNRLLSAIIEALEV